MKKFNILIVLSLVFFASCSLQNAGYKTHLVSGKTKNPLKNGVIYVLPQTVLQIDLVVEKQEYLKGPYADYGLILLGINNSKENDKVTYNLKNVLFSTYAEPDPKAYYLVETKRKTPTVVKLPNGIISSINLNNDDSFLEENKVRPSVKQQNVNEKTFLEPTGSFNYVKKIDTIYTETIDERNEVSYKKSFVTVAKEKPVGDRAKEAAEQILQIRAKKKELIYGEYEDPYSKDAIGYIHNNLDRMEEELLVLFTGKTISTVENKTFYIVPDRSLLVGDEQFLALCGFSHEKGITAPEEEDGTLVYATLRCEQDLHVLNNFLRRKNNRYNKQGKLVYRKKDRTKGIVYRIPDNALVNVRCEARNFSEKIIVNQYGSLVKLPEKELSVKFNVETGNILYVKPSKKK